MIAMWRMRPLLQWNGSSSSFSFVKRRTKIEKDHDNGQMTTSELAPKWAIHVRCRNGLPLWHRWTISIWFHAIFVLLRNQTRMASLCQSGDDAEQCKLLPNFYPKRTDTFIGLCSALFSAESSSQKAAVLIIRRFESVSNRVCGKNVNSKIENMLKVIQKITVKADSGTYFHDRKFVATIRLSDWIWPANIRQRFTKTHTRTSKRSEWIKKPSDKIV